MVDGQPLTFEVFGLLQGVLTMVDRETESVWTHLDGNAINGPMQGERMTMVAIPQMTWSEWEISHPDTVVLSPDTPFQDRYSPVTIARFNPREAVYGDGRLEANALVVGVEMGGAFSGYPVTELQAAGGVVNDTLAGQPVVVLYDSGAQTGIAYYRVAGGRELEFYNASAQGLVLRDRETGSSWDLQGRALSGPLAGSSLEFAPSFISEWYGWSAYHPETLLYTATH